MVLVIANLYYGVNSLYIPTGKVYSIEVNCLIREILLPTFRMEHSNYIIADNLEVLCVYIFRHSSIALFQISLKYVDLARLELATVRL